MRSRNKSAAVLTGCFVLALVALVPPFTQGDEWNLATRFSINHPFEVPNLTLEANTPYVIRLYDSPSERKVVQIYNEDQTKMLTMFMAISAERLEPKDETVFTFMEVEPQYPVPIKEWFYPGRLHGLEFVYPKDQAERIASHAPGARVTESAANITKTETTEVFEEKPAVVEEITPAEPEVDQAEQAEQVAQLEPVEQQDVEDVPQIAQNTEQAPVTEENQELPATAGELPLIALIGVLCLGAGLGLKVLSPKSQRSHRAY
jgi:hypothetical protein